MRTTRSFSLRFALMLLLPIFVVVSNSCDLITPQAAKYIATPWFKNGEITDIYSNTAAADLDINNFLYSGMLDLYLWRDSVPSTLTPASFTSPDSLLARTIRPSDRFSFIEKDGLSYLNQLQSGAVATPIFGFGVAYFGSTNLRVARVLVPSPAYMAGLRRGMRIVRIDGKPVPASIEEYTAFSGTWGTTLAFEVEDTAQTQRTITMTRGFFTQQVVPVSKVLTVGGTKVGYVMLASYTGNVTNELTSAFATLAEANVREVVLDLRYNGGGFVNAAGHLCGLLCGQLAGTTYVQYTYNSTYTPNNRVNTIPSLTNALRLTRVFVLVNGGTASASELTINALKPFVDVVMIGTPTVGKAVGSNVVFHTKSGYILQPISFKFANARGEADFLNGFTPSRRIADNVEREFGDPQEIYLRNALTFIQSGAFPALSAKEMARSVQSDASGRYVPERGDEILPALAPIIKR
jgi:carboxyl-terminal processing protease